jgi:glycosyltransferase involved in cell wall biosynthesis
LLGGVAEKAAFFLNYDNDIVGNGINRYVAAAYNNSCLKFLFSRVSRIFIAQPIKTGSMSVLKPWASKVRVLPFGVDTDKFKPMDVENDRRSGSFFFLSKLDRFHSYKGLDYLLEAMRIVVKSHDVVLRIGGAGELLPLYEKKVREYGLQDSVVFLGFVKDEQLAGYYNACDAFILPSISAVQEGWGLVAVEAMACGKPVITTPIVGASGDIAASNAGIVVKPADAGHWRKRSSILHLTR